MTIKNSNEVIAMNLSIKNIGKILSADIEIDGITVIAGNNNTGKSTIGKILYAAFNSFYDFKKRMETARENLFISDISKQFERNYEDCYYFDSILATKELRKNTKIDITLDSITAILKRRISVDDTFFDFLEEDIDNYTIEIPNIAEDFSGYVLEKYNLYFETIEDKEIYSKIFNTQIKHLFHFQINNISSPKDGIITLSIKNNNIDICLKDNKVSSISKTISLEHRALYIDDPFILDDVLSHLQLVKTPQSGMKYKNDLTYLLSKSSAEDDVEAELKKTLVIQRLSDVFNKINKVCSGNLEFDSKDGFSYNTKNISIHINNISAGLKTFAIIKTLLLNGSLTDNGIIILDEPEVHLHPEWQLLLAEIIVMLQKEFNLHILLNTHSPYFLEAIEVYSEKHSIKDKCKYYLTENNKTSSVIINVTNETEAIYKKLAKPFQDLENERYRDE